MFDCSILGYWLGENLSHPMLINANFGIPPKVQREIRNEVRSHQWGSKRIPFYSELTYYPTVALLLLEATQSNKDFALAQNRFFSKSRITKDIKKHLRLFWRIYCSLGNAAKYSLLHWISLLHSLAGIEIFSWKTGSFWTTTFGNYSVFLFLIKTLLAGTAR